MISFKLEALVIVSVFTGDEEQAFELQRGIWVGIESV